MRKLEENFKQSGGFYKEFKIGDLFSVKSSKKIFHANNIEILDNQVEKSYPYVVRSTRNNGIRGYIMENKEFLNPANTLSFAQDTFSVFYQEQAYFTGNKVKILIPKIKKFNRKIAIFMTSIYGKVLQDFTWGIGSTEDSIKDIIISLPVLPSCNENKFEIAFEYMESYIKELEAERLEELEAYLLATGLKDYKLTEQEKAILQDFAKLQNEDSKRGGAFSSLEDYLLYGGSLLDSKKQNFITHALSCLTQRALKSLDTSKWQEFPFYEIFIYERGKRYKKADHTSGKIPYISSSAFNNGIDNYVSPPSYMKIYTNKLTLANSGSVGTCFYHPYSFVASDHCMVIWLKDKEMNTHIALFLLPIFEKLKHKHDFGREINHDRLMQEKFLLPIDSKGNPDFAFMESFIKEIQKEHFLSLIEYYHKDNFWI
ncbi:restriction endonuclease subunit S [Campylobacter avium]|uniref:restriction endonuclease subunit S n=1 Tax=Campylobacter avium TaxID=522485 RepID=UPI00255B77AC|nr:restriction endonuclease subunit S [Campylobacter avium]